MDLIKIADALDKLSDTIDAKLQASVSEEMLPTDKRNLLVAFAPFFKKFHSMFKADPDNLTKQFYFAAIYGLVQIHARQISEKLVCNQSNALYLKSFYQSDASQTYHGTLAAFLGAHENSFQEFRRSGEAEKYIVYKRRAADGTQHDPNHHEGFSFGEKMAYEKDNERSQSSSFEQFAKRIFAATYFEMYDKELSGSAPKKVAATLAANAAAFVFAPVALPVTVLWGAYAGYSGVKANNKQNALEASFIRRNEVAYFRYEMNEILSIRRRSDAAIKRMDKNASAIIGRIATSNRR